MKVLIVEDNRLTAELVQEGLRQDGDVVHHAPDGPTAIRLLAQEAFDVILLAYLLPRMNGLEILQRLRQNPFWRHVPVLFTTAASDPNYQHLLEAAQAYPPLRFLRKPFALQDLTDILDTWIPSLQQGAEPPTRSNSLMSPGDQSHFCGLPAFLEKGGPLARRSSNQARWWLVNSLPGLSRDTLRQEIQAAFNAWTAVSNCSASEAVAANQADLLVSAGPIDGPLKILAQCELPGPAVQHLQLDSSEIFGIYPGSQVPSGKMDLHRILTHELGHFWGSGHLNRGLMSPMYSLTIDSPQPEDVAALVERYGQPLATVPTPVPTPTPDQPIVIRIWGAERIEIPGYVVRRTTDG